MSSGDAGEKHGSSSLEPHRPAIGSPVVFMCSRCRGVVGDSYDLISTNQSRGDLTLRHACNTVVDSTTLRQVPSAGGDAAAGSSYHPFCCASCSAGLGRVYRTTPQSMDSARDRFTFHVDALRSYLVGSARCASPAGAGDGEVAAGYEDSAERAEGAGVPVAEANALSEEVGAMKAMFVVFDRRMAVLEDELTQRAESAERVEAQLRELQEGALAVGGSASGGARSKRKKSPWI